MFFGQVFVTLRLPAVGEYGLEIYASEPNRDVGTFTHICQYLVAYSDRDFGAVYGQVSDLNKKRCITIYNNYI